MTTPILLPKIGWLILPKHKEKIRLGLWHQPDGHPVAQGEIVVTVETAKANLELEAPVAGLVFSMKPANTLLTMRDVLGVIADSPEAFEQFKAQHPTGQI